MIKHFNEVKILVLDFIFFFKKKKYCSKFRGKPGDGECCQITALLEYKKVLLYTVIKIFFFLGGCFSMSNPAKLETSSWNAFIFTLQDFLSLKTYLFRGYKWQILCLRCSCLVLRIMLLFISSLDLSHPGDPATYPRLAQFLPMCPGSLEWKMVANASLRGWG